MSERIVEIAGVDEFWQEIVYKEIREKIVRCRDCRYFRIEQSWDNCAFTDKYSRADGFCAWGVRKDDKE